MVKRKARALTRSTRQTGTSNMKRDLQRKALAPGKRKSKNGTIYYENRKNRSDVKGRDTPPRRKVLKGKLCKGCGHKRKLVLHGYCASCIKKARAKVRTIEKPTTKTRSRSELIKKYGVERVKRAEKSVKQLNRKLDKIKTTGYDREPLRRFRRHDLLPLSIRRKLPKLYSQDGKKNPTVYVKFFSPYSDFTWYITEFDGKDTLFGYVKRSGPGSEWGYSSFKGLVTLSKRGLQLVERDMYFSPKTISKINDIPNKK